MRLRFRHRRVVAGTILAALAGCAGSRGDMDLVEARLRDQQDLVTRYEQLVDASQQELLLARQETNLLRTQLAEAGASPLLPEHADVLLRAEKLAFHEMMTGARDTDGRAGDDGLNIVLAPQTDDGETVRLIGELEIEALDLSRSEGDQRIGKWYFTIEEAQELWHSGFLASGFQVDLPWKSRPRSDQVLLHARLSSPDGRQLNASHTVTVDLPVIQTAATSDGMPRIEPRRDRVPAPMPLADADGSVAAPHTATPVEAPEGALEDSVDLVEAASNAGDVRLEDEPQGVGEVAPFPLAVEATEIAELSADEASREFPSAAESSPVVESGVSAEAVVPEPVDTSLALADDETSEVLTDDDSPSDNLAPFPVAGGIVDDGKALINQVQPVDSPMIEPQPPAAVGTARVVLLPAKVESAPVPDVAIAPLDAPQRYRRVPESGATSPPAESDPSAGSQSVLRPVPPPADPESDPAETEAHPFDASSDTPQEEVDPAPFPVDVTEPVKQTPVIRSSVNWTDESIPYLR